MAQSELIVLKLIVLRLRKSAGMTQAEMAELLRVPLKALLLSVRCLGVGPPRLMPQRAWLPIYPRGRGSQSGLVAKA
jgi:transcriptional regulator with XRE-family HTH domain